MKQYYTPGSKLSISKKSNSDTNFDEKRLNPSPNVINNLMAYASALEIFKLANFENGKVFMN